jgi:hypothetical protein
MSHVMQRMMRVIQPLCIVLLCSLALAGCSGASQSVDAEEPGAGGGVDEESPSGNDDGELGGLDEEGESSEAEEEEEPGESGGGAGRLKVLVKASGEDATGSVRILTAEADPRVVDEGPASKTYEVPPGRYDVDVILHDSLDRPEKRLTDVPVKAGGLTEREVDFVIGQITLQPVRGRSKVGTDIRWRYMGGTDWFEQVSQAGQEVVLSAGRYDAEVLIGRTKITIRDIQVYEGRRTVYPEVTMR